MKRQSMENPVFYVQYAHARIASIGRKARRARASTRRPDLGGRPVAARPRPRARADALPGGPAPCGRPRPPRTARRHKVTNWVRLLAGEFHGFYHDCRVLSEEVPPELTQARLWLVEGVRIGLAIALGCSGSGARGDVTGAQRAGGRPCPAADRRGRRSLPCTARADPTGLLPDTSRSRPGRSPERRRGRPPGARRGGRHTGVRLRRGPPARRCREAVAGFGRRRRLRDQGLLVQGDGRAGPSRRGWRSTSRPGGSWPWPSPGGASGEHLVFHGNNKSTEELAAALRVGVRPDRRRLVRRDRAGCGPSALRGEALDRPVIARAVLAPRHARRRGPHPRVRQDRAGGHEVRFLAGFGGGGRSGEAAQGLGPRTSSSSACTRTLAARSSRSPPSSRRSPSSARSWWSTGSRSAASAGVSAWPTSKGEVAPSMAEWAQAVHTAAKAAGLSRGGAPHGRARTLDSRGRGRDALPGRHDQAACRACAATSRSTAGCRDNPRPVLYGSGYEAFLPRGPLSPGRLPPGWWASTASPVTSWSTSASSSTTWWSVTCLPHR